MTASTPVFAGKLPTAVLVLRAVSTRSPSPAGAVEAAAVGACDVARSACPDWAEATTEKTSAEKNPASSFLLVFIVRIFKLFKFKSLLHAFAAPAPTASKSFDIAVFIQPIT
ncbi:MAG TPA: hypothetical protein VN765_16835 [Candidatus Acidoferrum sp.]|nr:hypothetical protein [Candidatus Acidoferrum sp.]